MKETTLDQVSRAVKGNLEHGDAKIKVNSVSTDTRALQAGDLFIALRGENHDAHGFLEDAVEKGARALVVEKYDKEFPVPVIKVENTLHALQELARYNRRRFNVPVIGITGSSGKTTTKDMLASVLSQRYTVLKTRGNFNNEIGLPLTLLEMDESYTAVVLEMAMRAPGEIDLLSSISVPGAGIITNISEAHLEKLGSVQNIARAKAELLDYIPPEGFAVLNSDSPYLPGEARRCRGEVIFFGENNSDIRVKNITRREEGNSFIVEYRGEKADMFIPLWGLHNIYNAMAVAVAGRVLGLSWDDIARGLASPEFSGMRSEIVDTKSFRIINDAYNANPHSTSAALQSLGETAGDRRKIAVLGNMLELGPGTVEGHMQAGESAAYFGTDYLITVGELAEYIARGAAEAGLAGEKIYCCMEKYEALKILYNLLKPGDVILVKGSRGMRMEEIVNELVVYDN